MTIPADPAAIPIVTDGIVEVLVNDDPIRLHEFAGTFARLAHRPLRVFRVPATATRLVVGRVLAIACSRVGQRDASATATVRLRHEAGA